MELSVGARSVTGVTVRVIMLVLDCWWLWWFPLVQCLVIYLVIFIYLVRLHQVKHLIQPEDYAD